MKTFRPLLLLLLLAAAPTARALEFRVLSWDGILPGLRFEDGRTEVAVLAQEYSLSPVYRRTEADRPLVLYRTTLAAGRKTREVVATIPPPPEGTARAILLLAALPQPAASGETVAGRWLEDNPEAGTIRFYNCSAQPLALQAGGRQWLQGAGESRALPIAADARSLHVRVAAMIDGAWKQVGNVSKPVRSWLHVVVLMREGRPRPDFPYDPVELLAFYEEPPPAPAAPAP